VACLCEFGQCARGPEREQGVGSFCIQTDHDLMKIGVNVCQSDATIIKLNNRV